MTGSVVAGAQIMASADDTTSVWSASTDLLVGHALTADDLEATRVRFADAGSGEGYLFVDEQLPADLTLTRALSAGELVPASVLGEASTEETVAVSVPIAAEHVPTGLAAGSHVDVWVVGESRGGRRRATAVLEDVVITDVPAMGDSFTSSGGRQLVLAVPVDEQDALAKVLAASGDALVRIVGRG